MANSSIEEIKTIIRGLLVSSPEEVTVSKLRRDFKAQEGQDIPFYEFGFHDLTSFLRSLPDVCQISNNKSGAYAIVRLVESVKSAHVSSLVLRQRITTKGRRRHSSVPGRGRPPRFSSTPAVDCYKQKSVPRPLFEVTQNGYLQPSEFQLSSYKEAPDNNSESTELPEYNSLNPSCNGYVESWLLGNQEENTQQEIYNSGPDEIGGDFVNLETIVDHQLREILPSDEGLALKDVEDYLQDFLSHATSYGKSKAINFEQILRRISYIRIKDNYVYHKQYFTSCEKQLVEESFTKPECTASDTNGTFEENNSKKSGKGDLSVNAIPFVPQGNNEKVQRLEQNLYSLMKDHVNGVLASELKEKYKMKFAAPLNFQILGCETIQDLAYNMPHIFSFISLENGDFKLFPSGHLIEQTLKDSKGDVAVPKKAFDVPDVTKRNVHWLMQGYPNGLIGKDFEQTYKQTYLENVEIKEMGFSSIQEFLNFIGELNIIKIKSSGSDTWLFPAKNSVNLAAYENPLPSPETMGNDAENFKRLFPRDVVGPDLHVKPVEIPSWIMKGSVIEILVQEVNNPHNFWVTFCGESYSQALDSLMDELQAFYCSKSHSYRMPVEFIREGQDCVTQYVGEWHRARVTSVISVTEVEVYFYDYGTRGVVQKSNIHYLNSAHSVLPAQAIRAVLANIAPVGDKWIQDASKKFLQLIANKALIGIVVSADRINRVFCLFLCDTSGDDDIYVHEVLISEKFAVEAGSDFNEKESDKVEINNLKTEKVLENENFMLNEEDEKQPSETCSNLDSHPVFSPVLNNINHDDVTLHSDPVEEPQSSRMTSHSSLPYAMMNDNLNCSPSNSTSVCFGGTSSVSTTTSSSIVTKTPSNSSELRQQSLPPPGFSHILKCETESDVSDKTESHTLSSVDRNNQSQQSEIEFETPKRHIINDAKCSEGRDSPKNTTYKESDHHPPVKGVSSGVNADFSQVKAPYANNYYSYSNWPSVPQAYSNFPLMPASFSSVNPLTPLSLTPYNVPPIPSPLEFCNMWYYEQWRQQAFLQGMLAHQQMAASTYPPLPPGLYLPQNYSTLPSRNNTNISELHSPEQKTNLKKSSSVSQGACISSGTQTDVASGEVSKTMLSLETSSVEVSSRVKESEIVLASESKAHTNEDDCCLLKTISRTDMLHSVNTNYDNPDTTSRATSTIENLVTTSEKVVTKNIMEKSNCYYNDRKTNEKNNQDIYMCTNDTEINSQCSVSENLIKESPLPLYEDLIDQTSVDKHDSSNVPSSQSNTGKHCGSSNLQKESIKISDVQVLCANRSSVQEHNLKVQHHDGTRPLQNALESQREHNTKPGESGIVHHDGKHFHNNLQDDTIAKNQSGLKMLKIAGNDSVLESACSEVDEQEIAQVDFTDTPYREGIDLDEDDCHEHEMIEKAQQECITKGPEDNIETSNLLQRNKITVHNKLPLREWNDLIKEQKTSALTNSELTSGILSSVSKMCPFESSEKKKNRGVAIDDETKNWVDRFEVITDQLLEQEHLLTVQQENSCNNLEISSSIHDSHREASQIHSSSPELCSEFGTLSVSNELKDPSFASQCVQQSKTYQEYPQVNVQKSEFQNNLAKGEETTVDSVCKVRTNLANQVQPVVGTQLSNEVSASFISGPTQPAMSQKIHVTLPTESIDQTKDTLPSSQSISWKTTLSTEELSRSSLQRPLGRDTSKNFPFRNAPKLNSSNWHQENPSGKLVTRYQFVKKIYLCGKKINQINLDGRPYVLTDEIVNYFTPFNGRHVILKILEARKVEINFLELSRRRRPELFECLDKSDIECISRGPTGNLIGSVHFVPLRSVPYMLRALNKDDATLSMDVKVEMEKFDTNDLYWSGGYD